MTSKKRTYLALDPSLREFGWAVFKNDEIIDCGCIFTVKNKKVAQSVSDIERFHILSNELLRIITKHNPLRAYMEIPIGSRRARVAQALAMVQGMTMGLLKAKKIPFEIVQAKAVKKHLTGKVSAEKDEVVAAIRKKTKSFEKFIRKFKKLSYSKNRIEAVADAAGVYYTLRNK